MIPKRIHYCNFGEMEQSPLLEFCRNSWLKYLPDYEIIEWNEHNFDIYTNRFVREAYKCKKYAFVSDYARCYALYWEGGIYLDTDVEVLKSFNDLLVHKSFIGLEDKDMVSTAVIAAEAGTDWLMDVMEYYNHRPFILGYMKWDNKANPAIITPILKEKGLFNTNMDDHDELVIYPVEYFCANSYDNKNRPFPTHKTYCIHHFNASWTDNRRERHRNRWKRGFRRVFGRTLGELLVDYIFNSFPFIFPEKQGKN